MKKTKRNDWSPRRRVETIEGNIGLCPRCQELTRQVKAGELLALDGGERALCPEHVAILEDAAQDLFDDMGYQHEQSILLELARPTTDLDGARGIVLYLLARCRDTDVLDGGDTPDITQARADLRAELQAILDAR